MTFYANRGKFEGLSEKIGKAFAGTGISPNAWTVISIIPALAAAYYLSQAVFLPAAGLFILSAFLDMVDGAVARATGKASKLGAYIDTMVDRLVEFIIVLGLVLLAASGGLPGFFVPAVVWIFVYYFGSVMTTYAKSAAKEKELVKGELKGGILERAERLIILFVGIVAASFSPAYLTITIAFLAFLTNISALQRAVKALNA